MNHNDEHEDITVMMDYKGTNEIRPFYCVKCGRFLCELTGCATAIIPGKPGDEDRDALGTSFIAKCFGIVYLGHGNREHCTAKYYFN